MGGQKTIQDVKNAYWNSGYMLQKPGLFFSSKKEFWKSALRYYTMKNILKEIGEVEFLGKYKFSGKLSCVDSAILNVVSYLYAKYYIWKRMEKIKQ